MSKKVGRPPKISGDRQKFPATPKNFRRPPKISGDDQNDQNVAGGENVIFLSVESVEMHPIERASRCPGKARIWVILRWDRLFDQK